MAASSSSSSAMKRKRNQPGNPNPDAEVIALSPKTLMATNRFICEVCSKGFQREQNLQLHRRGHNLPWKLKQKTAKDVVKKKVYLCPDPTCAHHDPSRALGDLTGIKKHFSRKHGEKKYKCDKCSKKYAVVSDWKAHSKTCGTREYRCDCGTLFSRRDSFITHRAFCDALVQEIDGGSILNHAPLGGHLLTGFPRNSAAAHDQIDVGLLFANHELLRYGSGPSVCQLSSLVAPAGPPFFPPPLSLQQQPYSSNEECQLLNKPSFHSLMQQQQLPLENGSGSSLGLVNLSFFPGNSNSSPQHSAIFSSGHQHRHLKSMMMTIPSFYSGGTAMQSPGADHTSSASIYGSAAATSPFKPMPPSFGVFEGNNNHLQDVVNSVTGGGGGSSSSLFDPSPFVGKPALETINSDKGVFVSHGLDMEMEQGRLKLTRDFMGVGEILGEQHRSRISMDRLSSVSELSSLTWKPAP